MHLLMVRGGPFDPILPAGADFGRFQPSIIACYEPFVGRQCFATHSKETLKDLRIVESIILGPRHLLHGMQRNTPSG